MAIISNPNVPLDNKQLRIYNSDGVYTRVSVDESIARGYNQWKGWKCSAGVRGLYIDYDGNIWTANCASAERNSKTHFNKVVEEWRLERDRIFGPYPHIDWYNQNTEAGWPLPKEGWETCEQHVNLQEHLKAAESSFFANLGKNMSKDDSFDTTASAWKWESSLEDAKNIWGLLGNIREGMDIPDSYVTCPYSHCGCGADVILSKAATTKDISMLDVTMNGSAGTVRTENYRDSLTESKTTGVEMNFPIPYQVLWDLGRRCNYNCNYCWPSVHSNTEKFPSKESVIRSLDMIIDHWASNNQIRWNFGGGEPTMHPDFIEILRHLKSRNQWVLVTTNGSRSNKFWREAAPYINSINMSAHFASMDLYNGNEDRFIENCKIIMEHYDEHDDDHWLEIKLMTPPGFLERALQLQQRILALDMLHKPGANGRMKGMLSLVPIRDISDSSKLVGYSENEIEYFRNQ
jgi:organic radical activating enzyme